MRRGEDTAPYPGKTDTRGTGRRGTLNRSSIPRTTDENAKERRGRFAAWWQVPPPWSRQSNDSIRTHPPHASEPIDVVAEADIGIAGALVVAIARAAFERRCPPGAAADDLVLAFTRAARVIGRRTLIIVHLIEIVAP